jgi:tryptophanyl-tRNA synthetase
MARILTGIQSSGEIHLGNILGAIMPGVTLSKQAENESLFFIADFHSLTTLKNAEDRIKAVRNVAAAWLAFGFDTERNIFYKQSDIPEVCELTWYLSCYTPFPMLANAHSFKDKSENLSDVNAGLFSYPVLMTADILLYDAEIVPVGKDQKQHLEIARDIASKVNHLTGKDVFVLPEASISESVMTVPGTDGRKMSKSYKNYINIFQADKPLRKSIMGIVTDDTALEDPKDTETCNVFALYKLLASPEKVQKMRENYAAGNYGYGHAKQALFECIVDKFAAERARFNELMAEPEKIDAALAVGAKKARAIAMPVLQRVRSVVGF